MMKHTNNAKLCEEGCKALWNIVGDNSTKFIRTKQKLYFESTADNMIRGTRLGAISVILGVLNEHIINAEVFKRGCNVLEIFVKDEEDGIFLLNNNTFFKY